MKRLHILTILAALTLLLCCLLPTKAEAATSGYYTYTVSGGKATITDCSTSISGNITIPSTLGGYPVTCIGSKAFYTCGSLSSITIPDSVTSIGALAFAECYNLASITIPNSVTSIGEHAFAWCYALTSVTIPNNITSIRAYAFTECYNLATITIPDGVTDIENGAFSGCSGLTSITIPDSVTSIGDFAFNCCSSLTSVTIPDGVTLIGEALFLECSNLTSINIPNGIEVIRYSAFQNCRNLTSITIPDSVVGICGNPFYGCSSLKYNTYDNGKYIGNARNPYLVYCDISASSVTDVQIHEQTRFICGSFGYDLLSVSLGSNVEYIYYGAFYGSTKLQAVHISDLTAWFQIEFDDYDFSGTYGANPFQYSNAKLYLNGQALTEIVIPQGVKKISRYAFSNYNWLTSVTIPASVVEIEEDAFEYCSKLQTIRFEGNAPAIDYDAFYGVTATALYPTGNSSWTASKRQNYGGTLTWQSYHAHTWLTATCTTPKTCSACGAVEGAALGHSWSDWQVIRANTCTEPGLQSRVCKVCGEEETKEIPAAHVYGAYVVTLAPTCLDAGTKTRTCTICGNVDTQTVAPLRGLSEEVIDPKLYPYPESSHDYPNNVNETKTFTYPGAEKLTITFSISSVTESNYDKVYIYDANGSQLTVYTGSLSGKTLTITGDTFKIKLTSDGSVQKWGYSFSSIVAHKTPTHTWGEWKETTAPTCTEKGTETRTCSYCGLQESREGTALVGHSGQWMELVPATCATDGINARICTICGETETETVVATGHSYSAVVTAPTCTEKGYTTKTCATCGEISVTDYVDAIGHSYSSVVVEPTCTEQGYTTKTCATCGDVTTEYVPAKGHGWSAWITTVKPTCMTEGAQMRFCNCGTRETEVIAKLPHSCENYICTVCGELDYANTVLTGAVQANWNLTQDLYIDLNGFDLSGTIITNGFKVYGMDSTTDNYTCDSIGYFTCVDENGDFIVPERIYTEGEKQYMAICTEDRYSFHRFFVGTTHMSLEPEAIGLGYKAAVFGDEMVFAELAETKAFSFKLQLEGYTPVYRHFDSSELTSGESIALRIRNYDVENYSEHNLYAQVSLTLNDGTVIEAEPVSLTFRWLTEQVNANYADYTNEQIAQFKAMLQAFDIVKKWNIPNLI